MIVLHTLVLTFKPTCVLASGYLWYKYLWPYSELNIFFSDLRIQLVTYFKIKRMNVDFFEQLRKFKRCYMVKQRVNRTLYKLQFDILHRGQWSIHLHSHWLGYLPSLASPARFTCSQYLIEHYTKGCVVRR